MLLDLYTPVLSRYGVIENMSSLQWTRKWQEPGAFELHVPMRTDIEADHLIVKATEAGIVHGIQKAKTTEGDELVLTGSLLSDYIRRRLVWGTQTITGDPEAVMKTLVDNNMVNSTITERNFDNLTVEADQGLSGDSLDYQNTDVPLVDELTALSEDSGLGYDIQFNKTSMTFRVLEGLDRTTSQSTNMRAIFSVKSENILSGEFEYDNQKYTNVAKLNTDLYEEVVGDAEGYERREVYVKPNSVEKDEDGVENDETTQRALMQQQGAQKLTAADVIVSVKVNPYGNIVYKTGYDLGDLCTCRIEDWGVSMDARLVEIREIYEGDGFSLELVFGTGTVTFEKIVRRSANV